MGTKEKMEQDILIAQVKASILEEIINRLLSNKEYEDLEVNLQIESIVSLQSILLLHAQDTFQLL